MIRCFSFVSLFFQAVPVGFSLALWFRLRVSSEISFVGIDYEAIIRYSR